MGLDTADGRSVQPIGVDLGKLAGTAVLEVWRTVDGRVLLHQPGRGNNQMWIEVLPEAIAWLIHRLQQAQCPLADLTGDADARAA